MKSNGSAIVEDCQIDVSFVQSHPIALERGRFSFRDALPTVMEIDRG
jgi:hypothetical protein